MNRELEIEIASSIAFMRGMGEGLVAEQDEYKTRLGETLIRQSKSLARAVYEAPYAEALEFLSSPTGDQEQ